MRRGAADRSTVLSLLCLPGALDVGDGMIAAGNRRGMQYPGYKLGFATVDATLRAFDRDGQAWMPVVRRANSRHQDEVKFRPGVRVGPPRGWLR